MPGGRGTVHCISMLFARHVRRDPSPPHRTHLLEAGHDSLKHAACGSLHSVAQTGTLST